MNRSTADPMFRNPDAEDEILIENVRIEIQKPGKAREDQIFLLRFLNLLIVGVEWRPYTQPVDSAVSGAQHGEIRLAYRLMIDQLEALRSIATGLRKGQYMTIQAVTTDIHLRDRAHHIRRVDYHRHGRPESRYSSFVTTLQPFPPTNTRPGQEQIKSGVVTSKKLSD